ncbi:MAG: hypothetical protein EOO40_04130 [Deltaproteobacteria bacterium]|nr:MAG: hypothetical protein EOO40_04130 [Deltaproteobacteria bacterium]
MSTDQLPPHVRVTRFYTAVRRIPTLVGKLPNGGFIPGGPYTLGQLALMLLVAVGGFYTMPWWGGHGASLGNSIKLAVAVVITSMLSSKIRWRGRQVLPALRGALYSYTHGSQPRQGGRTPTARGPQRVRSHILFIEDLPAPARDHAGQAQDRFGPRGERSSKESRTAAAEAQPVRPLARPPATGVGASLVGSSTTHARPLQLAPARARPQLAKSARTRLASRSAPASTGAGVPTMFPVHEPDLVPGRSRTRKDLINAIGGR